MNPEPDIFQAVSDPNRRHILDLLTSGPLTINSLAENFDMSRPAVSRHIKILQKAGFISIRDIGRERYCNLRQEGFFQLQQWTKYFDHFWQVKLKNLGNLLDRHTRDV